MEKKAEELKKNKNDKGAKREDAAKEFDESLHDKKSVLHEIFTRTNALLLVADSEGKLIFVNPAFEKLTERTAKEVVRHHIECLHPPESWPFVERRFREHLTTGFVDFEVLYP